MNYVLLPSIVGAGGNIFLISFVEVCCFPFSLAHDPDTVLLAQRHEEVSLCFEYVVAKGLGFEDTELPLQFNTYSWSPINL